MRVGGVYPFASVADEDIVDERARRNHLWEQRRQWTTLPRRVRREVEELFAYAFVRAYMSPGTMKREDPSLYRFITRLEREVAARVGPYAAPQGSSPRA